MRQNDLLTFLINQTDFFDPNDISEVFTTSYLAHRFSIQRNTASHYLNQLVSQGILLKITTRPVCFLHKASFESQFFQLSRNEYSSISELLAENHRQGEIADQFTLLIGHNSSLAIPIEQLKTALFYPDGGLPLLITGDSGTGKSFMAKLLFEYAISHGIIDNDAPFIHFNCAQYASNPELLAANLFGYVKGAFTGASSDKPGAFESAQGGFLFLDEVHRLNADGQEKLFTYLDRKEIYRLGDSKIAHTLSVRLIFATTEEIHSTFLTTFIRRIPIHITLPVLEDRSPEEKKALILLFFWQEASGIGVRLTLSARLLSILQTHVYFANVGELKNIIKYAVASAWAKQTNNIMLNISIHHLPQPLITQLATLDESILEDKPVIIDENSNIISFILTKNPHQRLITDTHYNVLTLFDKFKNNQISWHEAEQRLAIEIENLFDKIIFDKQDKNHSSMLPFTVNQIREACCRLQKRFNIQFDGNSIYALAHYLLYRSKQISSTLHKESIRHLDDFLSNKYPLLHKFCYQLFDLIYQKLDINSSPMDSITLIIWLNKTGVLQQKQLIRSVILAHGYSTASSIANVVNRLLKTNLFESFDMPLDVTPETIARELMQYIDSTVLTCGLIILVDMGSLNLIHRHFKDSIKIPVVIINNVSTNAALYVGERILQGDNIEVISNNIAKDLPIEHQLFYPKNNKPQVIITTCATGTGAAGNLCHLLKSSIPDDLNIEFIAYDYTTLEKNKTQEAIFNRFTVIAIVGTLNPHIPNIPWFSLDSLISGKADELLNTLFRDSLNQERIQEINNAMLKNFSLHRVIESVTILDAGKVINQVERFLLYYEHLSGVRIASERKVSIYVHISCLIERLIRNTVIQSYPVSKQQCPPEQINRLRQAFSVIETIYSVKVPETELFYIHNLIFLETEFIQQDQEF